jgi:hypothetical protein
VTAKRYTAEFTGFLSIKKPGEYPYLAMNEAPVRVGEGGTLRRGRPPVERLRREICFQDLPEGCRRVVLDAYRELWELQR